LKWALWNWSYITYEEILSGHTQVKANAKI
jgi:hypothetical protein